MILAEGIGDLALDMKKKLLVILLVILGTGFFFSLLISSTTEFVWVSPSVNTEVFPHISTAINKIDKGIDVAINDMRKNGQAVSIMYKNAYGSGFLKHNPIPNDLDYSIGINLGRYDYNGQNGIFIAESIENKMSTFQSEFYDYISTSDDKTFYTNYTTLSSIVFLSKKKYANIKSINSSLKKVFQNKEYVLHTVKRLEDRQDIQLKFPFVLKSNEILIEDASPIQLFSNDINYSNDTSKFLREVTIILDFFVDIKDTRTNELKHIEIVSESFMGQRLQLSRRFFVPMVFIGEKSANFLRKFDILNDDEKYISYRLFNFKRHLQEFANLNELNDRPVKMFKRILQCSDLIEPVLDKNLKDEIIKNISDNLNNKQIQIMNDYSTSLGNLIQIMQLRRIFSQTRDSGEIYWLLASMRTDLQELKIRSLKDMEDVDSLLKFQNEIDNAVRSVKDKDDLIDKYNFILEQMNTYNPIILNIFARNTQHKKEVLSYIDKFNDIYSNAGFHKIELYWLSDNTIGVVKDDFTEKIKPDDLKIMALQNDLADVNYVLINKTEAPELSVRYSAWVRHNPTKQEEENWMHLRQKLLSDKKNFKIKRKFILKF